ncbi:MAG: hypothetical protein ACQETH_06245 [Candidatus Rifleibacteriota bacterium]
MFVFYGSYQMAKKAVRGEKMRCKNCGKVVSAYGESYFLVYHLFFIPLLPLGSKKELTCPECKQNPLVDPIKKDTEQTAILGVLLTIVLIGSFFTDFLILSGSSMWFVRGFLVVFILLIFLGPRFGLK